jgi:ATP-dependent helicase/nuclease subunit A
MKRIGHEMILASAGSGKTYALTHRFVRLLANGAEAERIVALTFTRKAAGEFFDEILKKLARAATEPGFARRLAEEIERPELVAGDFLRMLRAVVTAMPRLNLGTLDGFFARVVQAFPRELGIDGEFQILDEATARQERRRVLRRMFAAAGEPDAAQREFIEAFKRATFGVEEKRLAGVLDGFLDKHSETFLAAPNAAKWGDPERIWPDGCAWLA